MKRKAPIKLGAMLIDLKIKHMGLRVNFECLFFCSDTFGGCLKIDLMLGCGVSNHHVRAPCRECKPKKGINLGL